MENKEAFVLTIDGRPRVVSEKLKPLADYIPKTVSEIMARSGFESVTSLGSYVTLARNIRETGFYSTTLTFDGAFTSILSIQKIKSL